MRATPDIINSINALKGDNFTVVIDLIDHMVAFEEEFEDGSALLDAASKAVAIPKGETASSVEIKEKNHNLLVMETAAFAEALHSDEREVESAATLREVMAGKQMLCVTPWMLREYGEALRQASSGNDEKHTTSLLEWLNRFAFRLDPERYPDTDLSSFKSVASWLNARLVTAG